VKELKTYREVFSVLLLSIVLSTGYFIFVGFSHIYNIIRKIKRVIGGGCCEQVGKKYV